MVGVTSQASATALVAPAATTFDDLARELAELAGSLVLAVARWSTEIAGVHPTQHASAVNRLNA